MTAAFRINRRQYLVDGPTKPRKKRRSQTGPVQVGRFDPRAYSLALYLAQDDKDRVYVMPDGSGVIVSNKPRRPVWMP